VALQTYVDTQTSVQEWSAS